MKELCADADLKDVDDMFSLSPTGDLSFSKSQKEINLLQSTDSMASNRRTLTQNYTEKQNLMASSSAKLTQLSQELSAEHKELYGHRSEDRRTEIAPSHQHSMSVVGKKSHQPPEQGKASNPYVGSKTFSTNTIQIMPIATREFNNTNIMERINPENWYWNEPIRSGIYNGEYHQVVGGEMQMQNRWSGNSDSYGNSRMSPDQVHVPPQEFCATAQNPVSISLTQGDPLVVQQRYPLHTILHPASYSSMQTISQTSVKREHNIEQPRRKRLNC